MSNLPQGIWSAQNLAKLLLITPEELSRLSRRGVIPKAPGGYSVVESVQAYIKHLTPSTENKPTGQCTTQELADHVSVTPQRINQYVKHGLTKAGRNLFDLNKSCKWVRDYERQVWESENVPKEEALGYWHEQAKLSRLNQIQKYDAIQERRRQLIPWYELRPLFERIIGSLKDNLLGTGRNVAPEIAGKIATIVEIPSEKTLQITGIIAQGLEDATRKQLDIASRASIRVIDLRRPRGNFLGGPEHDEPSPKPQGERVGGRKKDNQPGK